MMKFDIMKEVAKVIRIYEVLQDIMDRGPKGRNRKYAIERVKEIIRSQQYYQKQCNDVSKIKPAMKELETFKVKEIRDFVKQVTEILKKYPQVIRYLEEVHELQETQQHYYDKRSECNNKAHELTMWATLDEEIQENIEIAKELIVIYEDLLKTQRVTIKEINKACGFDDTEEEPQCEE